jgi:hypothetical protein
MRTFVQKPKPPQQATPAKSTIPGRAILGLRHHVNSILHLQRTIGNQAVHQPLEANTRNVKGDTVSDNSSVGHDFSGIPVYANAHAEIQPNLRLSTPGDVLEREADRAAERVMHMPEPVVGASVQNEGSSRAMQRSDQTLSPQERSFFEPRFGHDFSQVRIHADARSAEMADALNAEAFTFGRDIYFGPGKHRPRTREADRLLAHELAHVVQQSRIGQTLQPKLKLTGTPDNIARVIAVLNATLHSFYYVSVDSSGQVKIDPIRAAHTSSATGPSAPEKALADHLWSLTTESGTTTVGVVAGGAPIVGSYGLEQIDIADIESLGSGQPGWNAAASLIHELIEQREKQLGTTKAQRDYGSATKGAHSKGLAAELGMIGADLESDTGLVGATRNPDGTIDGTRTVVFKYPDGTRYRVEVTLSHSNITGVTRTKLP